MRSSITIFLIGLVLGSTLGIGGLWTQVVQPAYREIEELNEEHQVMEGALVEAEETIEEVAASLREDAPTPLSSADVTGLRPVVPMPGATPATTSTRDRKDLATRLEKVRARMKQARAAK
jgi:hypothetical protein